MFLFYQGVGRLMKLTELRDAAHPGGQQTLFHGAQLRLAEGVPLAALARPLLLLLLVAVR